MSNTSSRPKADNTLIPAAIGAAVGAAFYFILVLGILNTLWGPGGSMLPDDPLELAEKGYWIGRVFSSWVNCFSFVAFGTAMMLLWARLRKVRQQYTAFDEKLLGDDPDTLILPEDALDIRKRLRQLDETKRQWVLMQLLDGGLQRARANWSAEDVGTAIKTEADLVAGNIEAGYSMIRYLAWAIPSIGFIGTVMGIGDAMGFFGGEGASNDISLAAGALSMAFDTTFVALVLSLVLMYFLHRVQAEDDGFLVDATSWCMRRFVYRMHITAEQQV